LASLGPGAGELQALQAGGTLPAGADGDEEGDGDPKVSSPTNSHRSSAGEGGSLLMRRGLSLRQSASPKDAEVGEDGEPAGSEGEPAVTFLEKGEGDAWLNGMEGEEGDDMQDICMGSRSTFLLTPLMGLNMEGLSGGYVVMMSTSSNATPNTTTAPCGPEGRAKGILGLSPPSTGFASTGNQPVFGITGPDTAPEGYPPAGSPGVAGLLDNECDNWLSHV
jgi:hypothetical protein